MLILHSLLFTLSPSFVKVFSKQPIIHQVNTHYPWPITKEFFKTIFFTEQCIFFFPSGYIFVAYFSVFYFIIELVTKHHILKYNLDHTLPEQICINISQFYLTSRNILSCTVPPWSALPSTIPPTLILPCSISESRTSTK